MASTSRQMVQSLHNRQFWTEFFLLYESLPVLWDMRNPVYKNRHAKLDAYDYMVEKLREIEPNADRENVLRKINIFRTNYRRECARINASHVQGRPYKTTLWYFELLNFLRGQDMRRYDRKNTILAKIEVNLEEKKIMRRKSAIMGSPKVKQSILAASRRSNLLNEHHHIGQEREDFHYDDNVQYEPDDESQIISQDQLSDVYSDRSLRPAQYQNEFHTFSMQHLMQPKLEMSDDEAQVLDVDNEEVFVNVMESVDETLNIEEEEGRRQQKTSSQYRKEFRHVQTMTDTQTKTAMSAGRTSEAAEILAKSWAIQYDEMSSEQKIYARKAIADILFEGCMGNLGLDPSKETGQQGQQTTQAPTSSFSDTDEVIESNYVYEDGW